MAVTGSFEKTFVSAASLWFQFDYALSYGCIEYLHTLAMLKENGWSPRRCIPHGGHQMSLNIAAGPGLGGTKTIPTCFSLSAGSLTARRSNTATSECPKCRARVSRPRRR